MKYQKFHGGGGGGRLSNFTPKNKTGEILKSHITLQDGGRGGKF